MKIITTILLSIIGLSIGSYGAKLYEQQKQHYVAYYWERGNKFGYGNAWFEGNTPFNLDEEQRVTNILKLENHDDFVVIINWK